MPHTHNSKLINAPATAIFKAFSTPGALEKWLAPDGMTRKVHKFDFRPGGGYVMSLYYNENEQFEGKTNDKEDRFTAKFTDIILNEKIVQITTFISEDEAFAGKMRMETTLEPKEGGTLVTMAFDNIPKGIKPEDNEEGTRQSLEKLAKHVELKSITE